MSARLLCRQGPLARKSWEIEDELTLGRSRNNTVEVPSRDISGQHARITRDPDNGNYYLEDLGSLNGTALDGVETLGRETLGRMHVVTLAGRFDFIFMGPEITANAGPAEGQVAGSEAATLDMTQAGSELPTLPKDLAERLSEVESTPPRERTAVELEVPVVPAALRAPAEDAAAAGPLALEVLRGAPVARYPLVEGENLVGRASRAGVRIESPEISRRHATLELHDGTVTLRDEGSRNHTYVGDRRITEMTTIEPGTTIRFGAVEVKLVAAE